MTVEKYMNSVLRTWRTDLPAEDRLLNIKGSLFEECGELAGIMKKYIFHGHDLDIEEIKKELGDIMFYLFAFFHEYQYTIEEIKGEFMIGFKHKRSGEDIKKLYEMLTTYVGRQMINLIIIFSIIYSLDLKLSDVLQTNIDKLQARYPDGFSEQASRERVE